MTYYKFKILSIDPVKDKLLARVDGSTVKGMKDFAVHVRFNNDNKFFPDGFFFDFLAVDDTISLGRRQRNFALYDALNWYGTEPGRPSFVLTSRLQYIMEQFNLAPCHFYGAKLRLKGLFYDYKVAKFLKDSYLDYIDFSKSLYVEQIYYTKEIIANHHFSTLLEKNYYEKRIMSAFNLIHYEKIPDYTQSVERPNQIRLSQVAITPVGIEKDMFWFPDFQWVISQRFRDTLIAEKVTGILLEEITNVEFIPL